MLGGNLGSLLYGDVSVMMCLAEAHNRTEVGFEQPTFHSVLIKFSQKGQCFYRNYHVLHKIICFGCVLESPHRGNSNTYPQHIILWRNVENYPFLSFDPDPRFSPFSLYVRWKSGVTFVRRCFRDDVSC